MFLAAAVTRMGVDTTRTIIAPAVAVSRGGALVRNDLEQGMTAPNIIILAKGTVELGNMGSQVGVPLQEAVSAMFSPGSVMFQGVNGYPAVVTGYVFGGSELGTANMIQQVHTAITQCPGSKIFLVGYSQGAQVTRKAISRLSPDVQARISGVIVFGDPQMGEPFPAILNNKVLSICNPGDLITKRVPVPLGPHLDYVRHTPQAAAWIHKMSQHA